MAMNIHLITHITQSVVNWGPLWSQSTFAFENVNGILGRYVKGIRYPIHQIAFKYILSAVLDQTDTLKESIPSKCPIKYELTREEEELLCPDYFEFKNVEIHTRTKLHNDFYTSFKHKDLKTAD